ARLAALAEQAGDLARQSRQHRRCAPFVARPLAVVAQDQRALGSGGVADLQRRRTVVLPRALDTL
ncbi:hypothetical protein, partial [Stenotrophomonas sp. SrG]|uniref:hypothetical protein n=1 Tax=Stenotrophomonas sp. SrG TaxID=3414430 RepID=UPI003CEEE9A9